MEGGPFDNKDEARTSYENYRKADSDLRDVLRVIGLRPPPREAPDLQSYLRSKASGRVIDSEDSK
jgi:hypothetical protein